MLLHASDEDCVGDNELIVVYCSILYDVNKSREINPCWNFDGTQYLTDF